MNEVPPRSFLPPTTAALHGVVVLDFSHVIAGPFATFYLAALGARVIKVENPHREDSTRSRPRGFEAFNHGKEVVRLDLASDEGVARAWALFAEADVVVDNMRPGVLDRFGFGEAALRARKPELIHCSISGYGHRGEWAGRPTYDHVVQAASGMTLIAGRPEDGPIKVGFPAVDCMSGILAALALIAAVRRRDLTGRGESIDVSMFAAAMQLMYPIAVDALATGEAPPRVGNVGYSGSPGAETFACGDGLLALGANTPQQMRALARVLQIEAEVVPLLQGQVKGFVGAEQGAALRDLIARALAGRSAAEMEQALNAAQVPAARVRDLGQAVQEGEALGMLRPWTLDGSPPLRVPGLGFQAETLFAGRSAPYPRTAQSAACASQPPGSTS